MVRWRFPARHPDKTGGSGTADDFPVALQPQYELIADGEVSVSGKDCYIHVDRLLAGGVASVDVRLSDADLAGLAAGTSEILEVTASCM